jgi:hypothetical protein
MNPFRSETPGPAIRKNWWMLKPNVISEVAVLTQEALGAGMGRPIRQETLTGSGHPDGDGGNEDDPDRVLDRLRSGPRPIREVATDCAIKA